MSGEPFHRCTHTALSPQGHIYVSDGYGNSRVHKYTPDGKLLMSWGEPGTGEGEFNIVHKICCDADGWVYVADRENHRVQVFDGNGKFETQWQNLHRPCGLCMPYGHQPIFYVGEVGPAAAVSRDIPNLGPRVSIVDYQGKLIGRFGDTPAGTELGKFLALGRGRFSRRKRLARKVVEANIVRRQTKSPPHRISQAHNGLWIGDQSAKVYRGVRTNSGWPSRPANHDEFGAVEAFDLAPQAAVAGRIGRIDAFRDDALDLHRAGLGPQSPGLGLASARCQDRHRGVVTSRSMAA